MPANSLEQEAMERVRRMYASFDNPPSKREERPRHAPPPRKEPEKPAPPVEEPPPRPRPSELVSPKSAGLLETLMKDKDQSLIMLLLVILMKDGADMNLLLALVYLLI